MYLGAAHGLAGIAHVLLHDHFRARYGILHEPAPAPLATPPGCSLPQHLQFARVPRSQRRTSGQEATEPLSAYVPPAPGQQDIPLGRQMVLRKRTRSPTPPLVPTDDCTGPVSALTVDESSPERVRRQCSLLHLPPPSPSDPSRPSLSSMSSSVIGQQLRGLVDYLLTKPFASGNYPTRGVANTLSVGMSSAVTFRRRYNRPVGAMVPWISRALLPVL